MAIGWLPCGPTHFSLPSFSLFPDFNFAFVVSFWASSSDGSDKPQIPLYQPVSASLSPRTSLSFALFLSRTISLYLSSQDKRPLCDCPQQQLKQRYALDHGHQRALKSGETAFQPSNPRYWQRWAARVKVVAPRRALPISSQFGWSSQVLTISSWPSHHNGILHWRQKCSDHRHAFPCKNDKLCQLI